MSTCSFRSITNKKRLIYSQRFLDWTCISVGGYDAGILIVTFTWYQKSLCIITKIEQVSALPTLSSTPHKHKENILHKGHPTPILYVNTRTVEFRQFILVNYSLMQFTRLATDNINIQDSYPGGGVFRSARVSIKLFMLTFTITTTSTVELISLLGCVISSD